MSMMAPRDSDAFFSKQNRRLTAVERRGRASASVVHGTILATSTGGHRDIALDNTQVVQTLGFPKGYTVTTGDHVLLALSTAGFYVVTVLA